MDQLSAQLVTALYELNDAHPIRPTDVVVFGVSTSEIAGKRIGTEGSEEIAEALFQGIQQARAEIGFQPVFQCCEHLNRACVVERKTAERKGWDEVSVIPVRSAGGAMASYAFAHLDQAICVETIQADAGVDIGDTWVGMHMRPVAVPVRPRLLRIGEAHITMAYSRPKLIGGLRARYE
ncbi:TIGR01440 family protein [Seinonella peptonophila]|uniref:UPF0340 protein SAMN05444392_105195 n=1 Tax=Seinonella peptonophila TaxID=112248 RepID=A0A1M4XUQ8_9BACL|nr:TIGR01440 family protein [Seinonella peptonophila]SHE97239.1 TIGR01440 family protein [Seinonella peptonophila]